MTSIAQIVKHPDYQEVPRVADLAVVFVSDLIFMSPVINALQIPYQNYPIADGEATTVVSWGFDAVSRIINFLTHFQKRGSIFLSFLAQNFEIKSKIMCHSRVVVIVP